MGYVYLAALVFGLGTLLLQVVLSHLGGDGDHDADADHDIDAGDGVGDHDVQADADVDHELDHAGDNAHDAITGSFAASIFLSMRFWIYGSAGFGLVGTMLHYLHLSGLGLTIALSVTAGLLTGGTAAMAFRALRQSVSSAAGQGETIGMSARVMVPVRKGGLGKVRVQLRGKSVDVLATTDSLELEAGHEVVLVEYRGDYAVVEPLEPRRSKP